MARGLASTALMTAPVAVSSCAYLQESLTSTMLSKPSRVPEPASRPTRTISPSSPPTSDQLVISPVNICLSWATARSSTLLSLLTMMAMPSRATMVPVTPVSSAFRAREERPMSRVLSAAPVMPAPEPVGS